MVKKLIKPLTIPLVFLEYDDSVTAELTNLERILIEATVIETRILVKTVTLSCKVTPALTNELLISVQYQGNVSRHFRNE